MLLQNCGADRLEIGFKPFLPPGVTDWADEDGATPSYNNVGGNPDQWYDRLSGICRSYILRRTC
ncbi:hypothetical protein [Muricomes intestini]|uniref:hypothetical protein n=1 Tax=Muricomes intestini TaxID=1796634 RepID=UPI001050BAFB|nr:hypothetical protein [Muricomes intestini]